MGGNLQRHVAVDIGRILSSHLVHAGLEVFERAETLQRRLETIHLFKSGSDLGNGFAVAQV